MSKPKRMIRCGRCGKMQAAGAEKAAHEKTSQLLKRALDALAYMAEHAPKVSDARYAKTIIEEIRAAIKGGGGK